ncbi:MAG TPA: hypothetical protein VM100_03800, partial [Longimicrobiales bacterium]|nr:hypothetical protein [Longimicrobiales bacterium]
LRGRAFELLGQRDSAIAAYDVAANRVSGSRTGFDGLYLGDTYERLAGLYQQRGDIANARKYYVKLVNLWKDADGELKQRAQNAARQLSQLMER